MLKNPLQGVPVMSEPMYYELPYEQPASSSTGGSFLLFFESEMTEVNMSDLKGSKTALENEKFWMSVVHSPEWASNKTYA